MKYILMIVGLFAMVVIPFEGKNNIPTVKNKLEPKKIEKREEVKEENPVLRFSDSVCRSIGVPPQLVREIGQNESGWRCIKSLSGGSDYGDLQVIEPTFNYWYERLELEGGKSRQNYIIVGIHYLKYNFDRYKSWEKARFAYARGHWRSPNTWTKLEQTFMGKIEWNKYDR